MLSKHEVGHQFLPQRVEPVLNLYLHWRPRWAGCGGSDTFADFRGVGIAVSPLPVHARLEEFDSIEVEQHVVQHAAGQEDVVDALRFFVETRGFQDPEPTLEGVKKALRVLVNALVVTLVSQFCLGSRDLHGALQAPPLQLTGVRADKGGELLLGTPWAAIPPYDVVSKRFHVFVWCDRSRTACSYLLRPRTFWAGVETGTKATFPGLQRLRRGATLPSIPQTSSTRPNARAGLSVKLSVLTRFQP